MSLLFFPFVFYFAQYNISGISLNWDLSLDVFLIIYLEGEIWLASTFHKMFLCKDAGKVKATDSFYHNRKACIVTKKKVNSKAFVAHSKKINVNML